MMMQCIIDALHNTAAGAGCQVPAGILRLARESGRFSGYFRGRDLRLDLGAAFSSSSEPAMVLKISSCTDFHRA